MGYYIRVMAEDDADIPVTDLRRVLAEQGLKGLIEVEEGNAG